MKKILKRLLPWVLYHTGVLRRLRPGRARGAHGGRFLILMYHRVIAETGYFKSLCVSPQHFARQIRYLKENFSIVTLEEAAQRLKSGDLPDEDQVVITFDDGYQDNYTHAFPVLRQAGVPATIFLTAGHINNDRIFWWDRVERLAGTLPPGKTSLKLPEELYPPELREAVRKLVAGAPERSRPWIQAVVAFLKTIPDEKKHAILDDLESQATVPPAKPSPPSLTWDQVREMAQGGIDFGSHTFNHPIMTQVTPEQARVELSASKREIEKHLDRPVRYFAYPNGMETDFNAMTERVLQDCGYEGACLAYGGPNDASVSPWAIKREYIGDFDIPTFAYRLSRVLASSGK
ncbi:MAG: polysaccharide deacetylase family protein [Candidatus Firestonebacteria bacterium]|nr:polysaccharide deacetylase family protein [Candidatus Firestonebacteria bacterium]